MLKLKKSTKKKLLLSGLTLFGIFSLWFSLVIVRVVSLKWQYPLQIYNEATKKSEMVFKNKKPKSWTNLDDISSIATAAILMSEDARFYQHSGFDFEEMAKALKKNFKKNQIVRGASTISQQVAKNLFLTRRKSWIRKIQEVFYTIVLELVFSKKTIFEIYLNIAEWGRGIYGIRAASNHYFQKSPNNINAKEGAFLATLLPSPIRYSAAFQRRELSKRAERHIDIILTRLVQTGKLSSHEAQYLKHFPLPFEIVDIEPSDEFVDQELTDLLNSTNDNDVNSLDHNESNNSEVEIIEDKVEALKATPENPESLETGPIDEILPENIDLENE